MKPCTCTCTCTCYTPHSTLHSTLHAAINLLDELVTEGASGAKGLGLDSHVLLGLRVEGGVLNEAVDEYPEVALDVEGLEVHAPLVLLLGRLQQLGDHLVHDVGHVGAALGGGGGGGNV